MSMIPGLFLASTAFCGAFTLTSAIAPYRHQRGVRELNRAEIHKLRFTAQSGPGPDRVTLIENTTEALGVRVALIRSAARTLDFSTHTLAGGVTTEALVGELWQAARRGVRVRVLLDGKTGAVGKRERRAMRVLGGHPNVEYRVYNPFRAEPPWRWNALMHDKIILADESLLLLGGRNAGDKCFDPACYRREVTDDRDVLVWDTGKSANGEKSVIPSVKAYFNRLWRVPQVIDPFAKAAAKTASEQDARPYVRAAEALPLSDPAYYDRGLQDYLDASHESAKVTLIKNPVAADGKEPWVDYILRRLALSARQSVLIQTPFSTAHPKLLEALGRVTKNARVDILTNSMASSPNLPAFSCYYSNRKKFLATGVHLHEYQSVHSLHGKSLVIDGRLSVVGSFNLDDRSMYIDTETMLVIDSPAFADVLTGAVQGYMRSSLEVGADNRYLPNGTLGPAPVARPKEKAMVISGHLFGPFRFLL